jgi:hypothetical protein
LRPDLPRIYFVATAAGLPAVILPWPAEAVVGEHFLTAFGMPGVHLARPYVTFHCRNGRATYRLEEALDPSAARRRVVLVEGWVEDAV